MCLFWFIILSWYMPRLSQVVLVVKNLPANAGDMKCGFNSWEDPLEDELAAYSSVLAWKIPRTEEPGRLQSMGLQRQTRLSDWAWACFLNIFFMFSLNNLPHSHWDHDFLICVLSSPCRTPTPNIGLTIKPWSIQSEETMQYYIWHYWRVFNYMEKGFSGITWKVSKMCI